MNKNHSDTLRLLLQGSGLLQRLLQPRLGKINVMPNMSGVVA